MREEEASSSSDRWASISDSALAAMLFYFFCLLVIARDPRMIDGTAWRKGRDSKTAWEGVVMVVGDDVRFVRRWRG